MQCIFLLQCICTETFLHSCIAKEIYIVWICEKKNGIIYVKTDDKSIGFVSFVHGKSESQWNWRKSRWPCALHFYFFSFAQMVSRFLQNVSIFGKTRSGSNLWRTLYNENLCKLLHFKRRFGTVLIIFSSCRRRQCCSARHDASIGFFVTFTNDFWFFVGFWLKKWILDF